MSHFSDIIVLIFHILKECNNTIYYPIQSILFFHKNVLYCFMTTPYIVRFKQLVSCPISDNIVPKVTPHSCNIAMLTCLISDSIVFKVTQIVLSKWLDIILNWRFEFNDLFVRKFDFYCPSIAAFYVLIWHCYLHKVMITDSMTDIFVNKSYKILQVVICGLCVLQVSCPFSNSHKNLPAIITWWTPSTFVVVQDVSRNVIHVVLDL